MAPKDFVHETLSRVIGHVVGGLIVAGVLGLIGLVALVVEGGWPLA